MVEYNDENQESNNNNGNFLTYALMAEDLCFH